MRLDRVELPPLNELAAWRTPDGLLLARVLDRYVGLHDQPRLALVDVVGRVHHFDAGDVAPLDESVR